jgi:hypothetical protein
MTLLNKNRIAKLAGLLKEQAVDEWIDEESADDDLVLGGGAASGSIHDEEEFEDDEEDEDDDITVYDALEDDDLEELDPDTDLGLYGEPLTRHQPDKHFAHHTGMYEGLSPEDYLAGYDESPEDEEPIDPPDWERDEWGKIIDPHFPDDADKEFRQRGQREQEEYHGIDLDNLDDLDSNDEDRMSDYEDEEENRHAGGSIKFETLKRIIRNIVKENEENFDDKTAAEGNKATKSSNKKPEKPKEPVNKYGANLSKREPTFKRKEIGNYSQPPREPIIPENLRRMIREAVRRHLNEKKKGLPPWLKPGFKNKKKTDDKSCESDPTSKKKTPFFLKKKSKK